MTKPAFLITVDTEGDDIWSAPSEVTVQNGSYLSRFQELCERHGLRPTYLVNYEMARCSDMVGLGRDAIAKGTAEIGMHLHAWNSPPHVPIGENDVRHQPYLIEYPRPAMRSKVEFITRLLEDVFGTKMLSHRAGRWAMNEYYASLLLEYGYRVDCSVTPHVNWSPQKGIGTSGGTDYRRFPETHYWIDPADMSRPGDGDLLEVPVTVFDPSPRVVQWAHSNPLLLRVCRRFWPSVWLRPTGKNLPAMLSLLERKLTAGARYVEFMIHSSELMPGGSPYFPTKDSVDDLYAQMETLFAHAATGFVGQTLTEFHRDVQLERG